jgi:hypothetical protein
MADPQQLLADVVTWRELATPAITALGGTVVLVAGLVGWTIRDSRRSIASGTAEIRHVIESHMEHEEDTFGQISAFIDESRKQRLELCARIERLEVQQAGLPTASALAELAVRIATVQGETRAVAAQVQAVAGTVNRIETHLIERGR